MNPKAKQVIAGEHITVRTRNEYNDIVHALHCTNHVDVQVQGDTTKAGKGSVTYTRATKTKADTKD